MAFDAQDLLKEVTIIFITSTIVWHQVNNREGTQLQPTIENWIKDLLSMALPITVQFSRSVVSESLRPQDPFSSTFSLSHQEASISLLFFSSRGKTD